MGVLGLIFWILVIWLLLGRMRGRRWGCWRHGVAGDTDALDREQSYVEDLERRVLELEERLDFTERLLAGRPGATASP